MQTEPRFSMVHVATMFGWMAREALQGADDAGRRTLIEQGVWRYGLERGQRMALRVRAAGRPLDWIRYMAYSEWVSGQELWEQEVLETAPNFHRRVYLCPWYCAWEQHGLLPYAGLYCRTIDLAIAHGYNPEDRLEVRGTRGAGDACCDFVWHGANLSDQGLGELERLRAEVLPHAVMPWPYHVAHIQAAVGGTLIDGLGDEGREIVSAARRAFAGTFGARAAAIVARYEALDFSTLPPDWVAASQRA